MGGSEGRNGGKPVQLLSYDYPDTIRVVVNGKLYTYHTSEYWARRAVVQLRFGDGWRGLRILKNNGREVNRDGT